MSPSLPFALHAPVLELAQAALRHAVEHGQVLPVPLERFAPELRAPGACFVSLHRRGALRGCIGTIEAFRPLVQDVAANAQAAALRDPRFPPVRVPELADVELSLHVLGPTSPIGFSGLEGLYAALRQHEDGLVLELATKRAVFLPVMWEQLPTPQAFVAALLRKAGIAPGTDLSGLKASRFGVQYLPEPVRAVQAH